MFLVFLLSFLLSWLSGMFVILTVAFYQYDEFSVIDITSFAVLTFAGCLILIPAIYVLLLKFLNKKVKLKSQFVLFPLMLSLIANLPAYFIIWHNNGDMYGKSEANLFTIGFLTIAVVFGLCLAWRNNVLNDP